MSACHISLFIVLIAAASAELRGPEDNFQELFSYHQKIQAVHRILKSRCPELVRMKRESVTDSSLPHALSAEKILYNRLLKSLVKCTSRDSSATDRPLPQDCEDVNVRGIAVPGEYLIHPPAYKMGPFKVWCDFFDGHGWTVFQKRFDGSVDFTLGWSEYKGGFGDVTGEHWLGLDKLHAITQSNRKLNIQVTAANGTTQSGYWSSFSVSDEQDFYRLNISGDGYYGSLASLSLLYSQGSSFSTPDADHDSSSTHNCAQHWEAGWWFNYCHRTLLNGVYGALDFGGIMWRSETNHHYKASVMRVSRF